MFFAAAHGGVLEKQIARRAACLVDDGAAAPIGAGVVERPALALGFERVAALRIVDVVDRVDVAALQRLHVQQSAGVGMEIGVIDGHRPVPVILGLDRRSSTSGVSSSSGEAASVTVKACAEPSIDDRRSETEMRPPGW